MSTTVDRWVVLPDDLLHSGEPSWVRERLGGSGHLAPSGDGVNARRIFDTARHPKSFISLDGADHLLTNPDDAAFVAAVLAPWAARYISRPVEPATEPVPEGSVVLSGTRPAMTGTT